MLCGFRREGVESSSVPRPQASLWLSFLFLSTLPPPLPAGTLQAVAQPQWPPAVCLLNKCPLARDTPTASPLHTCLTPGLPGSQCLASLVYRELGYRLRSSHEVQVFPHCEPKGQDSTTLKVWTIERFPRFLRIIIVHLPLKQTYQVRKTHT